MKTQSLAVSTTSSSPTTLRGGWLLFGRLAWLVIVAIAVGLFISGIPLRAENLRERYWPKTGVIPTWNQAGEIVITPGVDSPVYQAGILEGDILVAVNGEAPRVEPGDSLEDLIPDVRAGIPVRLTVRTGNHPSRGYTIFAGGPNAVPLARLGLSKDFVANYAVAIETAFALVCLSIAGLIFVRKSTDWLALLASLTFLLVLLGASSHVIAIYESNPAWRPVLGAWFSLILCFLLLFAFLFPVGQNVPRWTLALITAAAVWALIGILNPNFQPHRFPRPYNFLVIWGWLVAGLTVQIFQYRHSNPIQKQQTKWVVFGAAAATIGVVGQTAAIFWSIPVGLPTILFDLVGYPFIQLLKLLLPITMAIAILRYRLWDIDIIINRTLVYGTLTASVIGIYVIVVGVLGTTIQGRSNLLISILATGLVAVLVQPLRDRLQHGVNHMMYGERDDPVTVLSRLGERLEATLAPDAVLPSLVETVAQTLKLPYVAIEIITDNHLESTPSIAYGQPVSEVIRLPLVYQSETIGQLAVAPRATREALSLMDRHLLENIAHQAAMAVHAVSLTADLQRSRQRLVTAREEERRHLRRDLHDGLGPNLASQGLKLAAVKQLSQNDPASAIALLEQVMAQNQATVEEVRRLVYGLRPPALDELGLVAAIRDYVSGMSGNSTFQIEITEPVEGLPPLSAAVEVAAYRIVLEALTNVMRHAEAHHCVIRFSDHQNGSTTILKIEIVDDGTCLPGDLRAGVRVRSMRERAEELGGRLIVESQPCVTRVLAILPFGKSGVQADLSTQTERVDSKQIANLGLGT